MPRFIAHIFIILLLSQHANAGPYKAYAEITNLSISGPTSISVSGLVSENYFPGGGVGLNKQIGDPFCDMGCAEGQVVAAPGWAAASASYNILPAGYVGDASTRAEFTDSIVIDSPGLNGAYGTITSIWNVNAAGVSVDGGGFNGSANIDFGSASMLASTYIVGYDFPASPGTVYLTSDFIFGYPLDINGFVNVRAGPAATPSASSFSIELKWLGVSSISAISNNENIGNYSITSSSLFDYSGPAVAGPVAVIPEPNQLFMIMSGLALIGIFMRRQKQNIQEH